MAESAIIWATETIVWTVERATGMIILIAEKKRQEEQLFDRRKERQGDQLFERRRENDRENDYSNSEESDGNNYLILPLTF